MTLIINCACRHGDQWKCDSTLSLTHDDYLIIREYHFDKCNCVHHVASLQLPSDIAASLRDAIKANPAYTSQ